jgi:hypothetical protein
MNGKLLIMFFRESLMVVVIILIISKSISLGFLFYFKENFSYLEPYMTALKIGLQDPHSDVSSAALLALGETCAVLEVNYLFFSIQFFMKNSFSREKFPNIPSNFYLF